MSSGPSPPEEPRHWDAPASSSRSAVPPTFPHDWSLVSSYDKTNKPSRTSGPRSIETIIGSLSTRSTVLNARCPIGSCPFAGGARASSEGPTSKTLLPTTRSCVCLPTKKSCGPRSGVPSQIFDLTRLPLKLHDTLSLTLLLPLGALITAVLRNIVGLRTLGTFAPALLAMSFIHAAWGTALVILTVVIIVGLVGRSMLEKLHLLMVPRLSIVLTLIILCVVFAVSLLNYYVPSESAQSVLIPLVILTILIERFFVTSEEDSPSFAIQLVLGTLVVAAFCYLLLRSQAIGQLVLTYPEIHFFTIAAFIVIGRYTGYRLTELWRFRDLVQDKTETDVAISGQGVSAQGVTSQGVTKKVPGDGLPK